MLIKANNMNISSAVGGLAGACALTILNETVKKIDKDAPRLDLLGMNAVAKMVKGAGLKNYLLSPDKSMPVSLAGDLISNTLYFGMADAGDKNKTLIKGALLGLGAGVGAIALAKPLGLDEQLSNTPVKTKALTIAWYVAGGLVAAAVINLLAKKRSVQL
jgi:hypothetical protein